MSTPYSYINSDPYLEFFIRNKQKAWISFTAYLDSGAYISVLTKIDAQDLGLVLTEGRETLLHGVSGSITAYIHRVEIKLAGQIINTDIAFSSSDETPRLIGRKGIFENFVICFDEKHKLITFN